MPRAMISKTVLDSLIRARINSMEGCTKVEPLPVIERPATATGCNWTVPGWVGEGSVVRSCVEKLASYLSFLKTQFNVAPERDRRH